MITEEFATKFLDLKASIRKYDAFLKPFTVNPNPREQAMFGYPSFFRRSTKTIGYLKSRGYNHIDEEVQLNFDKTLKKYIWEAVLKRRQELVQELNKLANS